MEQESRATRRASKRVRGWLALVLAVAVGVAGLMVAEGPETVVSAIDRALHRDAADRYRRAPVDTDGDGLTNAAERAGWSTAYLGTFRTNPTKADTDGDGLPDGLEAGDVVRTIDGSVQYAGVSDPTRPDTDRDGIDDGDEYFLGMSPTRADTDKDGLADKEELAFGSDPTEANEDGDSYTDAQERDHQSDPMAYDLTAGQKVAATVAGFGFGDWQWGAKHVGRMNSTELESPEYLGGQLASGYVGIGDLRDVVADVGTLDVVGAAISLIAVVPLAGDATKTIAKLTKFAARGDRAERAVYTVVERLPWPRTMRLKVLGKVFGRTERPTKLPISFRDPPDAPRNHVVYKSAARPGCPAYVGISKDFPRRTIQHKRIGRCIEPEIIHGMTGLTRNEARAVEEYCIRKGGMAKDGGGLSNKISSIRADEPFIDEILDFGANLLASRGGTCPL